MNDTNETDLFGGTDVTGGLRADVRPDVAKLDHLVLGSADCEKGRGFVSIIE